MEFTINGESYEIKFSYRVINAVLRDLGLKSLDDFSKVGERFNIGNVHKYIHTALTASKATRDNPKPSDIPSAKDIEWEMDDQPNLLADFLDGFNSGATLLMGGGKTVSKELETGN